MTLTEKFRKLKPEVRASLWPEYNHSRGYAGMVLPFSSGHLLAFRVFYKSSIAHYKSVWHCTPQGEWSIYNDGPSLETTCPRWWGPVLRHAEMSKIDLEWSGENELSISLVSPDLDWRLSISQNGTMKTINTISGLLPLGLKCTEWMRHVQEWMAAQIFKLGDLNFSFLTPTGIDARIVLEEIYSIDTSRARWKGEDLGELISLNSNPEIGGVKLPKKPLFVDVQAFDK